MTEIPRREDFIAWGSVGALAASMMAFAWTFCAISGVSTPPSAAGTRMSPASRGPPRWKCEKHDRRRIPQADGASARNPLTRYVKAFRECDSARGIAHGNDLCVQSMRKHSNVPADVAKALNGDLSTFKRRAAVFEELFRNKDDSRPVAASRPSLPWRSRGLPVTVGEKLYLRVIVHHPRHHLSVRVDVRRRDIPLGPISARGAERICESFAPPRLRRAPWDPRRCLLWPPRKCIHQRRFPSH